MPRQSSCSFLAITPFKGLLSLGASEAWHTVTQTVDFTEASLGISFAHIEDLGPKLLSPGRTFLKAEGHWARVKPVLMPFLHINLFAYTFSSALRPILHWSQMVNEESQLAVLQQIWHHAAQRMQQTRRTHCPSPYCASHNKNVRLPIKYTQVRGAASTCHKPHLTDQKHPLWHLSCQQTGQGHTQLFMAPVSQSSMLISISAATLDSVISSQYHYVGRSPREPCLLTSQSYIKATDWRVRRLLAPNKIQSLRKRRCEVSKLKSLQDPDFYLYEQRFVSPTCHSAPL